MRTIATTPIDSHTRSEKLQKSFILLSVLIGGLAGGLVVVYNRPFNIFVMVFGLLVVLATILSAEFGLLVLVFLVYTRFSDIMIEFHGFPSVAKLFTILLVVAILARWTIFRIRPKGWVIPTILLIAYGLAGLGSILYSPVPDRSWIRFTDYVKDGTIAVIVVILLQRGKALRGVLWVMLISGIFLSSFSVYQYATSSFSNNYGGFAQSGLNQIVGAIDEFRVGGPVGDPNFFAQIVVVLVPISFERYLHEKKNLLKLLALLSLVLSVLSVILSYSRGGFLAMALVFIVLVFMYPPRIYYVPVIIISILIFTLFLPPSYLDRIITLGDLVKPSNTLIAEDLSYRGRLSENLAAWDMFRTHPLLGVGLNSYSYLFQQYSQNQGIALVAGERQPHNLYLEVAAETGVVGFSLFALLIGFTFRTIYLARRKFIEKKYFNYAGMVSGFGLGLLGYLTAAMFIHGAFARYMYLLIGVGLSLPLVVENTRLEEQPD